MRSDSSVGSSGQILNPTQKYCGNLGHKYDATSGLTYMRARYYEAEAGRFISEDPARAGGNFFSYCSGDPIYKSDSSGEEEESDDSFDPDYDELGTLSLIENAASFLAGVPLNRYKGIAAKTALRTLLTLGSKCTWVQNFLKFTIRGIVKRFTMVTPKNLKGSYSAFLAFGGASAAGAGVYIELLINARHAAWWDFCFGDEN